MLNKDSTAKEDRRGNDGQQLLNVDEVADLIGVSRSYAYHVIRTSSTRSSRHSGHYVLPGRVNRAYLEQKYFGVPRGCPKDEGRSRCLCTKTRRGERGSSNARTAIRGLAHSDDQARVLNAPRGLALGEGVHPQEGRRSEHDHGGFLRALRGLM